MGDVFPYGQGQTLSYQQIEQLWISNGGQANLAPIMAAIGEAEGQGRTGVINDTPSTGDYSVGIWQINYYDGLNASRTAAYGSPAQLVADPNLQAKAAIALAAGGGGLGNWTTYTSGRYKAYLNGQNAAAPGGTPATATSSSSSTGGPQGSGCSGCAVNLPSVAGLGGGCLISGCNLKALKGGLLVVAGGALFVVGGLVLVAYGLGHTAPGRAAAQAYRATPAGGALKAVGARRTASRSLGQTRAREQVKTEELVTRRESAASTRRYSQTRPRSEPTGVEPGRIRTHRGRRVNQFGEELL